MASKVKGCLATWFWKNSFLTENEEDCIFREKNGKFLINLIQFSGKFFGSSSLSFTLLQCQHSIIFHGIAVSEKQRRTLYIDALASGAV